MTRRVRVLVVDDAVVVRRLVTDVLAADPEIDVVGVAANGRIALQKIAQLAPDIITLDVEMPEMDGLETITEIRKTWPRLPVIMFSTLTERGAASTMEALSRGASDYVTKPANVGSVTAAQQKIREELIPRVKSLCGMGPRLVTTRVQVTSAVAPLEGVGIAGAPPLRKLPISIVAIGSSTGGPNALADVVPHLPADFPVPVVITQHMPPMFTRLLAERLSGMSSLPVREASDGMKILPGTVWIAPGDYHLVLRRSAAGVIATLSQGPPENSCRPAVDTMLRSVVSCFGGQVLSVILTGMGQDGFKGCECVREAGGQIIVQDEESSVVWGMPGLVARAGLADSILPLPVIAQAITERLRRPLGNLSTRSLPATQTSSDSENIACR